VCVCLCVRVRVCVYVCVGVCGCYRAPVIDPWQLPDYFGHSSKSRHVFFVFLASELLI
jgi:hypothetical protein